MSRNRPPAASLAALSLSLSQSHSDWENEEAWDSSSDNEAPPPVSSRLSTPRLVAHHSKQTSSQHSRPFQSLSSSSRDSLASRPAAALRSHSSKLNSITSGLSSPKHQANDISPSSAASSSHGSETFSPTSNGYSRPGSNPRAVSSTAGGGSGDDDEEDDDDDGPEVAARSTSASKLPGPAAFSADKLGQPWVLIDEAEVHEQPPPKEGVDALRPNLAELIADPFSSLREGNLAATSSASTSPSISRSATASSFSLASSSLSKPPRSPRSFQKERCERTERSRTRFYKTLRMDSGVDISELKSLAWNGIPDELRPIVWQLLLGYLPLPSAPRKTTLSRKRQEYLDLVKLAFRGGPKSLDQQIWHQIVIDIPRTRPGVALWQRGVAQRALERILYVWAIRHPASGYVQGINDLAIPFFQVFLSAYIDADPETWDIAHLPQEALDAIEADSFWCLSKLLDGIQDNYIFAQPGIVRSVKKMSELVGRIDPPLSSHLEEEGVEFMQFAFRWMNCLLMREINMECTIRMWDTYLAEGADAFSQYHLYVCSAFLVRWSKELQMKDFQEIIMYLQALPTQDWTDDTVRVLLSEAYVLMRVWQDADAHFSGK